MVGPTREILWRRAMGNLCFPALIFGAYFTPIFLTPSTPAPTVPITIEKQPRTSPAVRVAEDDGWAGIFSDFTDLLAWESEEIPSFDPQGSAYIEHFGVERVTPAADGLSIEGLRTSTADHIEDLAAVIHEGFVEPLLSGFAELRDYGSESADQAAKSLAAQARSMDGESQGWAKDLLRLYLAGD